MIRPEQQISEEEAIALAKSEFWQTLSHRERAEFQLFTDQLCMPFDVFHEAIEKTLGRPVFTHEFGLDVEGLRRELMGERPAPTFDEIIGMIPADKRVVLVQP